MPTAGPEQKTTHRSFKRGGQSVPMAVFPVVIATCCSSSSTLLSKNSLDCLCPSNWCALIWKTSIRFEPKKTVIRKRRTGRKDSRRRFITQGGWRRGGGVRRIGGLRGKEGRHIRVTPRANPFNTTKQLCCNLRCGTPRSGSTAASTSQQK